MYFLQDRKIGQGLQELRFPLGDLRRRRTLQGRVPIPGPSVQGVAPKVLERTVVQVHHGKINLVPPFQPLPFDPVGREGHNCHAEI